MPKPFIIAQINAKQTRLIDLLVFATDSDTGASSVIDIYTIDACRNPSAELLDVITYHNARSLQIQHPDKPTTAPRKRYKKLHKTYRFRKALLALAHLSAYAQNIGTLYGNLSTDYTHADFSDALADLADINGDFAFYYRHAYK